MYKCPNSRDETSDAETSPAQAAPKLNNSAIAGNKKISAWIQRRMKGLKIIFISKVPIQDSL
jgi:hypothetical protein